MGLPGTGHPLARAPSVPYAERIDIGLHQLRAFVAVAEELHFGNAGLRLGLSQPQVSRHVATLEQALGVCLFVRTARRVTLTDAGIELLADARETLAAAERLTRRARFVGRGGLGSVSVGFVWSTLGGYLAPLVAAATERHRHVDLSVCQLRFTELVTALRRGEVDLLITRPYPQEAEFVVTRLNRERTVVAIPEGHPLARRETIDPGDLDGEPIVSLARETIPTASDGALTWPADEGIVPSGHRTARSPSEALARVAAGLGIYYRIPASAVAPQAGVVYRELTGAGMSTLLVRRPEPPSSALAAIIELARDLFGDAFDASTDGSERQGASPLSP